jgi:hypothetical protein
MRIGSIGSRIWSNKGRVVLRGIKRELGNNKENL